MEQKAFTVKFSQDNDGGHIYIRATSYPFRDSVLIGSDCAPCAVFNWLRKILPDDKTTKAKVTITFEEKP